MLVGCSTFGTPPAGTDLLRVRQSPQYDTTNARFDNPTPGVLETVDKVTANWGEVFKFFFVKGERTPDESMPEMKPDMSAFARNADKTQAIWFGHSSVLLRMDETNILLDPVFSGKASPVPLTVGRFQKPALSLEELPEIDYIVISHDHYDHLDMETVRFFRDKRARFIVPLGVGSHLRGWGIAHDRITELDWWDATRPGDIEFIAAPARHFSGRGLRDKNQTLWASWVIRSQEEAIYFSGDSGYGTHFSEIGEKYGPFDAAFIETGQYNNRWRSVHMMPEESARAYFDLKAGMFIPIHWAMFELSMHTWYQPAMEISEEARTRGVNLSTPKLGQVVTIDASPQGSQWWTPWVDPNRPREWYVQKVN